MPQKTGNIYDRLPRASIWVILAVCGFSFISQYVGIDFSTPQKHLTLPNPDSSAFGHPSNVLYESLTGSLIHLLLEWSAVCVAIATAVLAFVQYRITGSPVTPIIGMALLCAGCMDAFHALAAIKLIRSVVANDNFIPFTWALSRMFNATILLIGGGMFLLRSKFFSDLAQTFRKQFVLITSLIFLVGSFAVVQACALTPSLPRTSFPEHWITRPFDVAPLILYVSLALYIFPQLHKRQRNVFSHALQWSMVPAIATQIHMAFGSAMLYDHHFNLAHFLKLFSYAVPFVGIAIDYVANHHRVEKQRLMELERAYASLEQKNRELEQFAYIASHDLQEPLRTIISFVNLLDEDYRGKLDDTADKYLRFITSAARRMSALITGLLEYSRIGRRGLPTEVDCNALIREIRKDLAAVIAETRAVFRVDPLPHVTANETELQVLFQNLISNAIKFRKENVRPEIRIFATREKGIWKFAVQDNGIGIAPKHQDKIFAIFQRLHARSKYEGTGIGLAHCQKIVNLYGGKIWVNSKPGEGSTFYFTLPGRYERNEAKTELHTTDR